MAATSEGHHRTNCTVSDEDTEVKVRSKHIKRRPLNRAVSSETHHVDPSYRRKLLKRSGKSIDKADTLENTCKILVLYAGGTIGMRSQHGVYSPEPNFLVPELRKLPMFHDPTFIMQQQLHMSQADDDIDNDNETPFVMPVSKQGKRVLYCLYEYEPLLDSANMTFDDYVRLATDIKNNYEKFDGFVILHGTDTMAYTASALSFMLENLGKPVILTGSQIPICEMRSDGRDNFLGALIMAGHYNIPEVTIYFHNMLLRGNRSSKIDSGAFEAFKSPNLLPLAELEVNIKVNWDSIFRPKGIKKFSVHTAMCTNVGILRLFPSITEQTVRAFLQPPMEGVVIQSYGAGNGPDARKDLLDTFKEAAARGLLILNITQCSRGTVSVSYAAGKALLDAGVIPGSDMTAEAALMKLSYILGKDEWSLEEKKKKLGENLRGELKVAVKEEVSILDISLIEKMAKTMKLSSSEEMQMLRESIFPSLLCSAAKEGDNAALVKLQQAGADLSMADYDGRTALHIATCEGHIGTVTYLLQEGAAVHARDRYGHMPIDDAVRYCHLEIIQILRDTGAHLNMPPAKIGMMLCNTAMYEEVIGLEAWHAAGADINQGDYTRRTALHVATAQGHVGMVKFLLGAGARIDVKDAFGLTPLDEVKKLKHRNQQEITKLLEAHSHVSQKKADH